MHAALPRRLAAACLAAGVHRIVHVAAIGVDARDLGGEIGAHPHEPAAQLVGKLEGLEIELSSGAGEQRQLVVAIEMHPVGARPGLVARANNSHDGEHRGHDPCILRPAAA